MLKYLGLALILLGAVIPAVQYGRYLSKRRAELDAFIELLKCMRDEIATYMRPVPQIAANISEEIKSATGFSFAADKDIFSEYEIRERSLNVGRSAKEILRDVLSHLGESDRDTELARIDSAIKGLCAFREADTAEGNKNLSVVRVISAAAGLLVVIYLI